MNRFTEFMAHPENCPCCSTKFQMTDYDQPNTTHYQYCVEKALKHCEADQIELLNECHPFIFAKEGDNTLHIEANEVPDIDIPFPIISIECLGAPLTSPDFKETIWTPEEMIWVSFLIIKEVSPKKYHFYIMFQKNTKRDSGLYRQSGMIGPIDETDTKQYALFSTLAKFYLDRLHKEKIGITGKGNKVKYKMNGEKKYFKFKNITYVSPKKYQAEITSKVSSHIEWSHRWEVRGHWREVKGIGKDRAGNYCVNGHTWVTPFVKGPENSPLVKKSRVMKNEEEVCNAV